MDIHYLEEAVIALLKEDDPDFAVHITHDFISYLKLESQDYEISKIILKNLLEKYLYSCWPIFSEFLLYLII